MTHTELDLAADTIDVRDIIARIEELEEKCEHIVETAGLAEWNNTEEAEELETLNDILKNLVGNGGDEKWRGDWYPVTLIDFTCFVPYVRELLEDCGDIPANLPHYVHIDWEATARDVGMDYSTITIEGRDYVYR